jgi:hypothetical protein
MTELTTLVHELAALSPANQERVREYVAFLRWRAGRDSTALQKPPESARAWRFNFLEHLAGADVRASRDPAGMEVKTAEATVGGDRRPALWMHPPVSGEAIAEFHAPAPAGVRDLRLRFAIGVRDGAQGAERLAAFRVRVDGWQVWSRAAWPVQWEAVEVALPIPAGVVLRVAFATDGMGDHQWAWAVWGEPEMVGLEVDG